MRLGRQDDVRKAAGLEVLDVSRGGGHELLGERHVIALVELAVERSRVHADANGDTGLAGGVDHRVDAFERADVPGVDAETRGTAPCRLDGELVVKVNVSHHGKDAPLADLGEPV